MAVRYLKRKKYRILKRNFRFLRGEIDIIALDQDCLVFVEVKMRADAMFGFPEEFVSLPKQNQIRKVAEGYLMLTSNEEKHCRFDVIAITIAHSGRTFLQHFKRAFE